MSNNQNLLAIKAAVHDFENATRAHENMGSQRPEDHHSIQVEFDEAKSALYRQLDNHFTHFNN